MRNLLALLGLLVLLVVGVGWYQGWYQVTHSPGKEPGFQRLEIDINQKQITTDVQEGLRRSQEQLKRWLDQANEERSNQPANTPPPLTVPNSENR